MKVYVVAQVDESAIAVFTSEDTAYDLSKKLGDFYYVKELVLEEIPPTEAGEKE